MLAAQRRAIDEGSPYDVEYRIVAPEGSVRWVEGKGRVEVENGTPVRMTGVCIVVTRRKEAELAREEANRSKDEFLGTLSHELRTPLNAIVGWVQMLQQGDMVSPNRVAHAIEVVGRNAKLQAQLIEDILDVTRIVAGKLDIERRPLLVPQLLETVLTSPQPKRRVGRGHSRVPAVAVSAFARPEDRDKGVECGVRQVLFETPRYPEFHAQPRRRAPTGQRRRPPATVT